MTQFVIAGDHPGALFLAEAQAILRDRTAIRQVTLRIEPEAGADCADPMPAPG